MWAGTADKGGKKDCSDGEAMRWRRVGQVRTRLWHCDYRFFFMYKYTFCGLRESILIIRKRESVESQWLACLSDELIRKYGLVHPECLRSAFYSLYQLFLSIRTGFSVSWNGTFWQTEKPLSQYGKGFLAVVFSDNCDACNVIRLIVRTLSYCRNTRVYACMWLSCCI